MHPEHDGSDAGAGAVGSERSNSSVGPSTVRARSWPRASRRGGGGGVRPYEPRRDPRRSLDCAASAGGRAAGVACGGGASAAALNGRVLCPRGSALFSAALKGRCEVARLSDILCAALKANLETNFGSPRKRVAAPIQRGAHSMSGRARAEMAAPGPVLTASGVASAPANGAK